MVHMVSSAIISYLQKGKIRYDFVQFKQKAKEIKEWVKIQDFDRFFPYDWKNHNKAT